MLERIKRLVREEEGATMVEYGLMVALIAVVAVLIVAALGGKVADAFDQTQKNMGAPEPRTPTA